MDSYSVYKPDIFPMYLANMPHFITHPLPCFPVRNFHCAGSVFVLIWQQLCIKNIHSFNLSIYQYFFKSFFGLLPSAAVATVRRLA